MGTVGKYGSLALVMLGVWWMWTKPSPDSLLTSSKLDTVISSMLRYEANRPLEDSPRIAVGYGACRDLFVSGGLMMVNQSFPENPHHYPDVANLEQLRQMYAYFFQAGAAAERFVSDPNLFAEFGVSGGEAIWSSMGIGWQRSRYGGQICQRRSTGAVRGKIVTRIDGLGAWRYGSGWREHRCR